MSSRDHIGFCAPYILIQLRNVNPRNAHFSNYSINSIRTSYVHHEEHSLYVQFCMVNFSCTFVSCPAGGRGCWVFENILPPLDCLHNFIQNISFKMHVQNVFLMRNPWISKQEKTPKIQININWKVWISLVYVPAICEK